MINDDFVDELTDELRSLVVKYFRVGGEYGMSRHSVSSAILSALFTHLEVICNSMGMDKDAIIELSEEILDE